MLYLLPCSHKLANDILIIEYKLQKTDAMKNLHLSFQLWFYYENFQI